MANGKTAMASGQQTVAAALANLCSCLGSWTRANQESPSERELDRLLKACEDEPVGVRRHVAMLKRKAWWV